MAIFKEIVDEVMQQPGMSKMRPVIEKEILHYDIFQALDNAKLLKDLVFQGGTSLRLCRGSRRFSEDLDFAGGFDFNSSKLKSIKEAVESYIGGRYGLVVTVKEPKTGRDASESGILVDKWQVSVETSPEQRDLPRQKIKLEVANIPAYTKELAPLKLNYKNLQGYSSPIFVQTETINEVMADKVLAFPACIKTVRHRDIWDLAWLVQQGAELDPQIVIQKIDDYKTLNYIDSLKHAMANLNGIIHSKEFADQMSRFIDSETMTTTIEVPEFKDYLAGTVNSVFKEMLEALEPTKKPRFRM